MFKLKNFCNYLLLLFAIIFVSNIKFLNDYPYMIRTSFNQLKSSIFPKKQNINICLPLQDKLETMLYPNKLDWSITILDNDSNIIVNINGDTLTDIIDIILIVNIILNDN